MYAMLHIEASGNVSQEDFIKRNSAIYEGIEIQNMAVEIIAYDEEQLTVTYQTSFDWDDSIVTDVESERQSDRLDVSMGAMPLWEYRMKWYGETEEQAKLAVQQPEGTVIE